MAPEETRTPARRLAQLAQLAREGPACNGAEHTCDFTGIHRCCHGLCHSLSAISPLKYAAAKIQPLPQASREGASQLHLSTCFFCDILDVHARVQIKRER